MLKVGKGWKLYLIHHSHTDIGYTDRQEKIERYHVDFIKQAIDILEGAENGKNNYKGFKWTCENFWQVENFLSHCNDEYKEKFEYFVNKGLIDISLNYLNMTELVDRQVLEKMLAKGRDYANRKRLSLDSAMTADINGFSWGYCESLYKAGVRNLFSCLHAHHGMHPLFKKQIPFWWESPEGNKLLVWNGEQYHLGNEFFIMPNAHTSYQIEDEFVNDKHTDHFHIAEKRIYRYIENLEKDHYPYSYVPAMISGLISDNASPNGKIIETINKWNQKHSDNIEIELITLNEFFRILRKGNTLDIPTYSGDWNDWWADGVGSTPAPTKIYKDAQRKYNLSYKLDPEGKLGKKEWIKAAEQQMMMYAEHTWGYSSSVSEPWNTLVNDLDYRKAAYAVNANRLVSKNLDEILSEMGEVSIQPDREKLYKIINPHDNSVIDKVIVYIEGWESIDGKRIAEDIEKTLEVVDLESGNILECQIEKTARAIEIEFIMELEPREERIVKVSRKKNPSKVLTIQHHAYKGAEGVEDIAPYSNNKLGNSTHGISTQFYTILFDHVQGIKSIKDRKNNRELVHSNFQYAPFTGIYEKTDVQTTPYEERRRMGRNRKGRLTNRYASKLKNIELLIDGPVYVSIKMDYELEGTNLYSLLVKVYKDLPKIECKVRIHKKSEWAPENLYISLPFTLGNNTELFVDKTGTVFRPAIDQLPGSNTEFYLLQNGLSFLDNDNNAFIVAIKDSPLITLGTLDHHLIELCGEGTHYKNKEVVYSWVMNNFWETNFKVDLSGFYEFEYQLFLATDVVSEKQAMVKCQELNEGLIGVPI
ncbi:glycosyl hydrolase [Lederbergia ruris]|uniref:glycoside hydrolase family 38 N-terminal domain-containing protein n=1 Tax=Lederbergia ruris TaxID=217495 RepID=UPI0039A2C8D3